MIFYDYNGKEKYKDNINCKIIAHRGYHLKSFQNTIDSYIEAAKEGFNWIEIDTRVTTDGIYIMAHDNSVTMYNNGTQTSVNIGNSAYETIKNYTWDSEGNCKLCTLQAVFNAMKLYNMKMIIDLKSGTNADVMDIATISGVNDRIMLSYKYADSIDMYKKYDSIPVRIYPSNYSKILELQDDLTNPLYADFNAQGDYGAIANALAAGIPIIFSGCTLNNKNIWQVLANGVMANNEINIPYDDFAKELDVDYDVIATITPSLNSVSVAIGGNKTISATSNVSTPGGYVYGFTEDPLIARTVQSAFGSTASFTITGVSAGETTLKLFTGSGEIVKVPVVVS